MAFVLLLLLSITTLVQVETQSAQIHSSKMEAEQNALLGLQQALGELQKSMGPDQRISATAEILSATDPSRKQHTGVWVSDPNGSNVNGSTYAEGDLVRWLVSDFQNNNDNESPAPTANAVTLLGSGSLEDTNNDGNADDPNAQITVTPRPIGGNQPSGNYAWWIGDEGVKARINFTDASQNTALGPNATKQAALQTLSSSARGNVATLTGLSSIDLQSGDLASKLLDTADLTLDASAPDEDQVKAQFHDLTTYSSGVLADAHNGGLKQDLSLAFELSDADFNRSVFGSNGPDTILSTGFGEVQPIFRLPNTTGVDANGPTWHLLRDYYTIYQRMVTPMTDPIFDAQAFVPNRKELGNPSGWEDLAALRYINGNTISAGSQGDPLRSAGGALSIPVKANYLPYVQRNLVTMGLQFRDAAPPEDDTSGYDFHNLSLLISPAFVVHNPFNVKVKHNGLASYVDHVRFQIKIESLVDSSYKKTRATSGNWHMLKTGEGTLDPGEVKIYEGVRHDNQGNGTAYSQQGLKGTTYWAPPGAESYNFKIPVDPAAGGPNLRVFYQPYANDRWAYWVYHSISIPAAGDVAKIPENMTGVDLRNGGVDLSNYGGHHSDYIYLEYKDWYGGEDSEGRVLNTMNHLAADISEPYPFINYDCFLKPAEEDSLTNPFPYPGLTHTNPLAPITMSRNLFPTSDSVPNYGWPVFAPNWQLSIYTTGLTPGMDFLQSTGTGNVNGYWGSSNNSGQSHVAMIELPTSPPISIGQLQHANIGLYAHMPALAIGNSFASPYIPSNATYDIFQNRDGQQRIFYDLSYLSNEVLWDRYFFSSYSRVYDADVDAYNGTLGDSFDSAFDTNNGSDSLPNPRMELALANETIADARTKLFDGSGDPRSTAYERAAENLFVKGSFNVHSTSVNAWKTMLASARDMSIYKSGESAETNYTNNRTPLARLKQPIADAFDNASGSYGDDEAWGGFATLSDIQLDALANAIVAEIKLRVTNQGTIFTSLSAFVNRSLSNDNFGLAGLLQAAIDKSGINSSFITTANIKVTSADLQGDAGNFPVASNILDGNGAARSTATSASANLTQGDLLQVIGSFASVRSDTFRIRSYGEALDPVSGEPNGRAWCEAIVQRTPEPVNPGAADPSDSAYWEPQAGDSLGRKFKIIHFRWLSENEV